MLTLHTCHLSEIGGRSRNEDACGYWASERSGCWIVSDGAGGHGSGDVASRLIVTNVLRRFQSAPRVAPDAVVALLRAAHEAVVQEKRSGSTRDDMHATAVILLLDVIEGDAVWAHVGDTRLYWFRLGRILHRTRDHSLVQQMMDAGLAGGDATREHPKRSILTAAMGAVGELPVAWTESAQRVQPGDRFLICSDGWWEHVLDAEMEALLQVSATPEDWLARMAELIRARAPSGNDNYTAVCVALDAVDGLDQADEREQADGADQATVLVTTPRSSSA